MGAANAVFSFTAAFFVFRNTCCFFNKNAQIIGACLDQTGNHALLNNRVAARPQTGAKENISDIATAALHPIEKIGALRFTGNTAADRDFGVAGVFTLQGAVTVIKYQLNTGLSNRFAGIGAIENHIGHCFAAQVFRRTFAQHPAHRINNIRLTAAIGPHHRGHIAWKACRSGINKGFKAGQPDAFQTHESMLS